MLGPRTELQAARQRLLANRRWLDENIFALQSQYGDRWIAVLDQQVIACDTWLTAVQTAVAGREEEAVIMRVPVGEIGRPI